jgi:hypothetical protein
MDAVRRILQSRHYVLEKVTGESVDGAVQYAFVVMPESKQEDFRAAVASAPTNPEDWGVVVAQGLGEPPADLADQVLAKVTNMA